MRENASRGFVNGGYAPFAYQRAKVTDAAGREHWTYELGDEEQVKLVHEIFELATDHGLGAKVIAQRLNDRGLLAPGGGRWRASTVNNILDNPVYVGDLEWMKTKKKGRTGRTRTSPDERVVVRNAHPPIVDRDTFERRRAAAKTRQFAVHTSPHRHVNYLLGRLIRCGDCGASFVGRRREYTNHKGDKQTALAYYCSSYVFSGANVCKSLPLDMAWLEGSVIAALRARFVDPVGWTDLKSRVEQRIQARRRKYGMDPQAGEAKLVDIDRKIQNYYRAIGEGLDPTVCKQLVSELQQKKQELETELATLRTEDYYVLALEKNLGILETFRQKLADGFERLPFGVQRQVVVEFVESISIEQRREVAIHLKVALDNDGVRHLCDELEAVEKGAWKPREEDTLEEAANRSVAYGQPGPSWYPRRESNAWPSD